MSKNSFNTMTEVSAYLRNAGLEVCNFDGWRLETNFGTIALENGQLYVNWGAVSKKQFDSMINITLAGEAKRKLLAETVVPLPQDPQGDSCNK